jgi:hypothetical protein
MNVVISLHINDPAWIIFPYEVRGALMGRKPEGKPRPARVGAEKTTRYNPVHKPAQLNAWRVFC